MSSLQALSPTPEFYAYFSVCLILSILLLVGSLLHVACACCYAGVRRHSSAATRAFVPPKQNRFGFRYLFRMLIALFAALRATWYLVLLLDRTIYHIPFWWNEYYEPLNRLLPDFGSLALFAAQLSLAFYYWALRDKYRDQGKLDVYHPMTYYLKYGFSYALIICFLAVVLAALDSLLYSFSTYPFEIYKWTVLCGFFPLLHMMTSLIFTFLALRWYSGLLTASPNYNAKRRRLRRLGVLVAILHSFMFITSVIRAFLAVPMLRELVHGGYDGLFDMLFFLIFEWIPAIATLIEVQLLLSRSKKKHHVGMAPHAAQASTKLFVSPYANHRGRARAGTFGKQNYSNRQAGVGYYESERDFLDDDDGDEEEDNSHVDVTGGNDGAGRRKDDEEEVYGQYYEQVIGLATSPSMATPNVNLGYRVHSVVTPSAAMAIPNGASYEDDDNGWASSREGSPMVDKTKPRIFYDT